MYSSITVDVHCVLCGTREGGSYGEIYDIGLVCHRCSLLSMGGPQMALMPHCPKIPDDVDPYLDPPTEEDYESWVRTMGNSCVGIDRVREIFTDKKIGRWFEEKGGSVLCSTLNHDPIPSVCTQTSSQQL